MPKKEISVNTDDILSGLPPKAVALINEARQRFSNPDALNTWLLTPITPAGKRPIDYLIAGEYALFRSFLLRVRTSQEVFHLISSRSQAHIERSRGKFTDTLKRLRPRARRDEGDV